MDTEALKSLLSDFDLTKFVPALDTVLGWVEMLARIAVMAGPVLMLGLGLIYLLAPPKEANYRLGYRFWWSMASLDAWQFTQKLAGIVWSVTGMALTVAMTLMIAGFVDMEPMDMLWYAIECIGWQLLSLIAACFVVNTTVFVVFDRKGYRRWERVH